jgi:hypothetical protein
MTNSPTGRSCGTTMARKWDGCDAMHIENLPTDQRTHEAAISIARRCRSIIQVCLREEEWADADREFYRICREELDRWNRLKNA